MSVYYNENDKKTAAWLRAIIEAGLIADGEVDDRSIKDVSTDDVRGFTQCHFFAGIGGWGYALRLAGWPDERPVWTGSCPCQAHSSASRGRRVAQDLWPEWVRLIAHERPDDLFGEQVDEARGWLDTVCDDLENMDYTVRACILPAVSVGKDHVRERIYFAGHTHRHRQSVSTINGEASRLSRTLSDARRVATPHGLSRDMVALSGFGNAIVPQVAAAFIEAYCESTSVV